MVVDQLVADGVTLVGISPGSRSGALAVAAESHREVETFISIDERSAAFRALGATKAGRRAAVISTSGTAVANYLPAVVEADMACVPIVILTADRPEEMHGVGANQTIPQSGIYGSKVRASLDVPAPDSGDQNSRWRSDINQALSVGLRPQPGPVHINVAFREPTVPVADDGRTRAIPYPYPTPRLEQVPIESAVASDASPPLEGARGIVVAGDGEYDGEQLLQRATELGWPVVATVASGMRDSRVITTYQHLLSQPVLDLRPDVVVAVGAVGPSQNLERYIASIEVQVRVDSWGRVIDPNRSATLRYRGDVIDVLEHASTAPQEWREQWHAVDEEMRSRLNLGLEGNAITGGSVAKALSEIEAGAVVAASSLPIRELDAHYVGAAPVFANRGASGIDGFVSTAMGVAGEIDRTVALSGDLALLHDSNGLLGQDRPDLVLVVLDNNGGGLFDSLPQAEHAPSYERLFVTPHDRDLGLLARFHEVAYVEVGEIEGLVDSINRALTEGGVTLIRVPIDREHDRLVRTSLGA